MRSSRFLVVALSPLLACGGKVIFDTSSAGTGGFGGATSSLNVSGSTSPTTVGPGVVTTGVGTTVVGTTVGTAIASTAATGGVCSDPGPPVGSMAGISDCNGKVCEMSSCAEACSALYDCGRSLCGGSTQLCPGFPDNPLNHDSFVTGTCTQSCMQTPPFKAIINPNDCFTTITTLKNLSPQFANFCQGALGGP